MDDKIIGNLNNLSYDELQLVLKTLVEMKKKLKEMPVVSSELE